MKITVQITPNPRPNSSDVMRTYGFGDPHMVKYYNMDTQTDGRGKGNYSRLDYAMWDGDPKHRGQNGGRQSPLVLDLDEMNFIEAIQPNDYDIKSKMTWFGKDASIGGGRPCWKVGNSHYCDSIVYGSSVISVKQNSAEKFTLEFLSDDRLGYNIIEEATFFQLNHFRREMMDMTLGPFTPYEWKFIANGTTKIIKINVRQNIIPLIDKGLIQVATQSDVAVGNPNRINCTERGIKLFPVWDPKQYALYTGYDWYIWGPAFYKEPN